MIKKFLLTISMMVGILSLYAEPIELENASIKWSAEHVDGKLTHIAVYDKINEQAFSIGNESFWIQLRDWSAFSSSDCKLVGKPVISKLAANAKSTKISLRDTSCQITAKFFHEKNNCDVIVKVILQNNSTYVRHEITIIPKETMELREIVLLNHVIPRVGTVGTAKGSPIVGDNTFVAFEHPMASNQVKNTVVRCALLRNAEIKKNQPHTQSLVIGVTEEGQLRRGFAQYIERERAHPYRQFLQYNSWFDISWDGRKYTQNEAISAINQVGQKLYKERNVKIDSFLLDDGWDDEQTLWQFHKGLPNGFANLKPIAEKYQAALGFWISPFGGYGEAKNQRILHAKKQGYETNAQGFSLNGLKYFNRFRNICQEMIGKYGANQIKFDGLSVDQTSGKNPFTRDGDAMLNLITILRKTKPTLFINQTIGTWPSPFWLQYVDTTWRGGEDRGFIGGGSKCQQWITYRDTNVYRNVVKVAPHYPISALMLHGVILAKNAQHLSTMSDKDFKDQVYSLFGSGSQMQELYITPSLLSEKKWNDLAEAAKWAKENADVLKDSHWIGGDPSQGDAYGFASWSEKKGILVLRNPSTKPTTLIGSLRDLFELPKDHLCKFNISSLGSEEKEYVDESTQYFHLKPFEVAIFEATPY